MTKQYAVLHTEKGKGTGGGSGNHIDRKAGHEHTFKHADPNRKHLNREYASSRYQKLTMSEAIKDRIKEGYNNKRKMRPDTVKYLETILSGSHDQMIKLQKEGKLQEWVEANAAFMKKEFGSDNVVRFTLHLDELTPHIHCVHVPLTKDGRMSAREVMGQRNHLSERQDRYAKAMASFELHRGEKNTGVIHDTAKDFYRRIKIVSENISQLTSKGVLGVNKNKTIENYDAALKTALMELLKIAETSRKIDHRTRKKVSDLEYQISNLQKESLDNSKNIKRLEHERKAWKNNYEDLLINPKTQKHEKNRTIVRQNLEIERQKEREREERKSRGNNRDNGYSM